MRVVPPLSDPWIDDTVSIVIGTEETESAPRYDALITRLRHLDASNRTPVSIKKEDHVDKATALMLCHNFSQLPVMQNERNIEGVISWRTIGEAVALGRTPKQVSKCMETEVSVLPEEMPLTEAIDAIIQHEFIMVKLHDGRIGGPVTSADLAGRYHSLTVPFLLVSEIESSIRKILSRHAEVKDLQDAKYGDDDRTVEKPEDLTFGEYITVLSFDSVWSKLALGIDKSVVADMLQKVRKARNDIMHFHPDDDNEETESTLIFLRSAARLFEKISRSVT